MIHRHTYCTGNLNYVLTFPIYNIYFIFVLIPHLILNKIQKTYVCHIPMIIKNKW